MGRVLPFIFVAMSFVVFFVVDAQSRRANGQDTLWNEARAGLDSAPIDQAALSDQKTAVATAPVDHGPQRAAPVLAMPVSYNDTAPSKPVVRRLALDVQSDFGTGSCYMDGARRRCLLTSD